MNAPRGQHRPDAEGLGELCCEILDYLTDHPGARETVEGILEWWLLERDIRREFRRVQQALDYLVERDQLMVIEGADGRRHYALIPDISRETQP